MSTLIGDMKGWITMKLTEKQKNCPYCHEKGADHRIKMIEGDPDGQAGLVLRQDGWHLWTADPFTFEVLYPIGYCPMCGRPLNEEEE